MKCPLRPISPKPDGAGRKAAIPENYGGLSPFRFALKRVLRRKLELALALAWSMAFALVPMQFPVLTGDLVSGILGGSASLYGLVTASGQGLIGASVAGLVVISAGYALSGYYSTTWTARLGRHYLADLRNDLMSKLDHLSLDIHSIFGSGELLNRVVVDTQSARPFVQSIFVTMTTYVVQLVYPAVMIVLVSPLLGAAAGSVLGVQLLADWYLQRKLRVATRTLRATQGRVTSTAKENLDGIETIQTSNAEAPSIEKFVGESDRLAAEQIAAQRYVGMITANTFGLTSLGLALTWWWGGMQVASGAMTLGTLVMVTGFVVLLYAPSRQFTKMVNKYQKGLVAFERLQEVMEVESSVMEVEGAPKLPARGGMIEFHDVSFAYGEMGQWSLSNVDLSIPSHKLTAITGRNGSGKSSLLKLMVRLYDPTKGEVLIDGQDVRGVSLQSLREQIAVVPQDPVIFSGTVSENVRFGRPDATDAEVKEACDLANATGFIGKLGSGLDTVLGHRGGVILSAGQAQRIAIARALLRRPRILLMDEPLSSLDVESEDAISQTLTRLKKTMTIVVVTHDSATTRVADRVVVMESGKVIDTIDADTSSRRPDPAAPEQESEWR